MQPIDLIKYPEGRRFREVFKSPRVVTNLEGNKKSALTHIYFELKAGEVSRFHTVASDETWNLYQGAGLNLCIWDESDEQPNGLFPSHLIKVLSTQYSPPEATP